MEVGKDIIVYIHLSKEENLMLQNALTLLQNITKELNNPDVEELRFSYECDRELIDKIIDKANEIQCELM